jgi:hypothetical protein
LIGSLDLGPDRPLEPQEKLAIDKEILACVSNSALITGDGKAGMLKIWIDGVKRAGVKNYMVIAIDDNVGPWFLQVFA